MGGARLVSELILPGGQAARLRDRSRFADGDNDLFTFRADEVWLAGRLGGLRAFQAINWADGHK